MRSKLPGVVVFTLAVAGCASTGHRQEGKLAPNAPVDQPGAIAADSPEEAYAHWQELIGPRSREAMATYPSARQRYLDGLSPGETFFVTVILRDSRGHFEQVFILVDEIDSGQVKGRIASDILGVEGYRRGAPVAFQETQVVDWLISKPDGSEDGNLVGKYLDTLQRK